MLIVTKKYCRHVGITKATAELKVEKDGNDAPVWKFLLDIVTLLGSDGMSSDESGDENMEMVFHTRMMPWRRNITREVDIIDTQRTQDKDIFTSKGAKLAKHIRSGGTSSRRPAAGLP